MHFHTHVLGVLFPQDDLQQNAALGTKCNPKADVAMHAHSPKCVT